MYAIDAKDRRARRLGIAAAGLAGVVVTAIVAYGAYRFYRQIDDYNKNEKIHQQEKEGQDSGTTQDPCAAEKSVVATVIQDGQNPSAALGQLEECQNHALMFGNGDPTISVSG
jgi:uncharacterized membrane protein YebE (DUF533 family)